MILWNFILRGSKNDDRCRLKATVQFFLHNLQNILVQTAATAVSTLSQ